MSERQQLFILTTMFNHRSCRCHDSIFTLFLALSWIGLNWTSIAEAFGEGRNRRPPIDHSRRASFERILFLTLANFGFVPNDPSYAILGDNIINAENDLTLAQPLGPSGEPRPSAPLEYLLPAARVGRYVYQLLSTTEELARLQQASSMGHNDSILRMDELKYLQKSDEILAKLDDLFLSQPSFIKTSDPTVSRGDQYGKYGLPIIGEIGVATQKQQERRDRAINVGFVAQLFEVGELVGERRQWNQLQTAEKKREGASEIRRAFNIYTTNLNFSPDKYQWIGSREEKSRRIRNDKLPTTTDVIRSDLDARDLYRNQIQTSLEDARAEYVFQKRQSGDDLQKFDPAELLDILGQAKASADKWFGFIEPSTVKSAIEIVQQEQT